MDLEKMRALREKAIADGMKTQSLTEITDGMTDDEIMACADRLAIGTLVHRDDLIAFARLVIAHVR